MPFTTEMMAKRDAGGNQAVFDRGRTSSSARKFFKVFFIVVSSLCRWRGIVRKSRANADLEDRQHLRWLSLG